MTDKPQRDDASLPEPDAEPTRQGDATEQATTAQAFTKVCPRCSVQTETAGNFCPHCGMAYGNRSRSRGARVKEFARSKAGKRVALGVILALVLAGVGTGVGLKIRHDNEVRAEQVAAAKENKLKEDTARAEAAAAAAKQEADEEERRSRRDAIKELEASIVKDAKARVTAKELTGPILSASCNPLGGGSTDDLTALTTTFECIAVNKVEPDGQSSGYVFSATINWNEGNYTWHLGR